MKNSSRWIIMIFILAIVVGLISGCSSEKTDEDFIANLSRGLDKRWNALETIDNTYYENDEKYLSAFKGAVEAETNTIGDISLYVFENQELGDLAKAYDSAVREQIRHLSEETDVMELNNNVEYQEVYANRVSTLYLINEVYPLQTSESNAGVLNDLLAEGELQINLSNAVATINEYIPSMVIEKIATSQYEIILENPSSMVFDQAIVKIIGYNGDEIEIGEYQEYITEWQPGEKSKVSAYFEDEIVAAKVQIELKVNDTIITTETLNIEMKNELIINLSIPSTPLNIDTIYYNGNVSSTCTITEIDYMVDSWYEGEASVSVFLSGQKIYDMDGDENIGYSMITWKVYDSEQNVVDSGTAFTPEIKTGESFVDVELYLFNRPVGDYTLELSNG